MADCNGESVEELKRSCLAEDAVSFSYNWKGLPLLDTKCHVTGDVVMWHLNNFVDLPYLVMFFFGFQVSAIISKYWMIL